MDEEKEEQLKYPDYNEISVRLSSFTKWPSTVPQTPMELAEAGLFYVGFGDVVRCYSCGGGLKKWENGDIPWDEHFRCYPDCEHLKTQQKKMFEKLSQNQPTKSPPSTERNRNKNEKIRRNKNAAPKKTENKNGSTTPPLTRAREKTMMETSAIETKEDDANNNPMPSSSSQDSLTLTGKPMREAIAKDTMSPKKKMAPDLFGRVAPELFTHDSDGSRRRHYDDDDDDDNGPSTLELITTIDEEIAQTMERLKKGMGENQTLRRRVYCHLCGVNIIDVLFTPCQHYCYCMTCVADKSHCPKCNMMIKNRFKSYMA